MYDFAGKTNETRNACCRFYFIIRLTRHAVRVTTLSGNDANANDGYGKVHRRRVEEGPMCQGGRSEGVGGSGSIEVFKAQPCQRAGMRKRSTRRKWRNA